jgi:DNA invertase Pin-like site-specific DNA recombinase
MRAGMTAYAKTDNTSERANPKVRRGHLDRLAYLYIRQSTLKQVIRNTGSGALQYEFKQRAVELGWPSERIVSLDTDQAVSAASASNRKGYLELIDAISSGRCGAILCVNVDRLSRSDFDGLQLLRLCYVADTLVIDKDGVYDLREYNDRLVLGIKNLLGFAEHYLIASRSFDSTMAKARSGEHRYSLPAGLVHGQAGQIVLDPDEDVRRAVGLIFELFERFGQPRKVCRYFSERNYLIPRRIATGGGASRVVWGPLSRQRVLNMLKNPNYAGAYAFGRGKPRRKVVPCKDEDKQRSESDPNTWAVLRLDDHEGYITWEQYLRNIKCLSENKNDFKGGGKGVIRSGAALLQGTPLICGKCGRRMSLMYNKGKSHPAYACDYKANTWAGRRCQWIPARQVDHAVEGVLLRAVVPAQLRASIKAADQIDAQANKVERQYQAQLRRARCEADLAYRYLRSVDPENRHAAGALEKEWDEKLREVERLERSEPEGKRARLTEDERRKILSLAEEFPRIWRDEATKMERRKQLLRLLVKKVFLIKEGRDVLITIRWQTDAYTRLTVVRPDARLATPDVIERVRELAPDHTDTQIAEQLNMEGLLTRRGERYTKTAVTFLRRREGIPNSCPEQFYRSDLEQRGDGRYSLKALVRLLGIRKQRINKMCTEGSLDAIRAKPGGPWWILISPEEISRLKESLRHDEPHRDSHGSSKRCSGANS